MRCGRWQGSSAHGQTLPAVAACLAAKASRDTGLSPSPMFVIRTSGLRR
jgi:hypothetical protein